VPRSRTYRNSQGSFRRSRPNRDWAGVSSTGFTAVAASTKVLLGSFTLANPGIDETILRSVGTIAVESDQGAAVEDQIGAFGMVKVTDTAFAIGITAIPSPITDIADDGWFLYVPFAMSGVQGSVPIGALTKDFDSRAKRVLEDGTTIAIVAENASASHGFSIAMVMRVLGQVRGTR